jgi:hypothetical protein
MSLPDVDALATYGGALFDYSAPVDPTTDRPASGANQAYNNVAAMTQTACRAWVRLTLNGSATPVLVAHASHWGNAIGVAPTFTRTSAGIYTITWPATVLDFIPNGAPGFATSHTVNFRGGWTNVRGATIFQSQVTPTAANIGTLYTSTAGSGTLADPGSATDVDVYMI